MKRTWRSLQDEYAATLASHLAQADEAALLHAHELGRKALSDGIGILDLVLLHHQALARLGASGRLSLEPSVLDGAAELLAESLSPFEMSLRGYSEANANLAAMNERLQQAKAATEWVNRELEAFSYSVAHDLRGPLRSVDGFSQLLLQDNADQLDEEGRRRLEVVRSSVQRMSQLIEDLLRLSQMGRREMRRVPFELSAIVRTVALQIEQDKPTCKPSLSIEEGVKVNADPHLLQIVLENLLGNAWKFTSKCEHATIEFGSERVDGEMCYYVRDNGAGFNMKYAGKLFAPFQRLHSDGEFQARVLALPPSNAS